jgi:mannose-6-phosphate isomerase-like protein (cupin superfamily)
MASFSPSNGPALLATVGVEFRRSGNDQVPADVLADVLPEGERDERAVVIMDPPDPAAPPTGVGRWHVNNAPEAHLLREGRGQVQFVTPDGIVTVEVEPGDVMVIRGAEHRFRALTPVTWVLHYGGPEGAELVARDTDRTDDPWPT